MKRILLMYVSERTGHHKAALSIEKALKLSGRDVETSCINALNYTSPFLEKIISRTYMGIIKRKPEVWEFLYDNPNIVRRTKNFRETINKRKAGKLKKLIDSFEPDAIICTQAFPCGLVADYKKTQKVEIPLFGVLTDYAPHSYWIYDNVDAYFVPSADVGEKLENNGIKRGRIVNSGIPVDPVFCENKNKRVLFSQFGLNPEMHVVLLMGGSQGIGPMKETFNSLLRAKSKVQIIAVAARNRSLLKWFTKRRKEAEQHDKTLTVFPYINNIDELMEIASLAVTKPGGITTAESCAKGLPLLIISPIPGQEKMNSEYLIGNRVAVKIDDPRDVGLITDDLLCNKSRLAELSVRARNFSKPLSSVNISEYVLSVTK